MIAFTDKDRRYKRERKKSKVDLLKGLKRWYRLIKITGRFKGKNIDMLYRMILMKMSWLRMSFCLSRIVRALWWYGNNWKNQYFHANGEKGQTNCRVKLNLRFLLNLFHPNNGHLSTNIKPSDVPKRGDSRLEWNVIGFEHSNRNSFEVERHVESCKQIGNS